MKKCLSILCALALLCVTAMPALAGTAASQNPPQKTSYSFAAGSVKEFAVNSGSSTDSNGNVFYPLHSSGTDTTVSTEKITVITDQGSQEMDSLQIRATGEMHYIPTDENGKPYELDPNSVYSVRVSGYVKSAATWSQLFFGGGVLDPYTKEYTRYPSGNFPGSQNGNEAAMSAQFPIYRTSSFGYQDKVGLYTSSANGAYHVRYFEDYNTTVNKGQFFSGSYTFSTGDFELDEKGFQAVNSTNQQEYLFGNYFTIMCSGGKFNAYNGSELCQSNLPVQFNLTALEISKVSQGIRVNFDANGGTYSDGSRNRAQLIVIGSGVIGAEPTREGYIFRGYSLKKDGEVFVGVADASLNHTTFYAVWEYDPYWEYDRFSKTVDFSSWTVQRGQNSWAFDDNSDPYFSIVRDQDAAGGAFLRFYSPENGRSQWLGSTNITLTSDGSTGGLVLDPDTKYQVKIRYRVNKMAYGSLTFYVSYGTFFNNATANIKGYQALGQITEECGWTETQAVFTTPAEYQEGKYNKCYIGLGNLAKAELEYDVDYITIEKLKDTEVHLINGGEDQLHHTITDQPGTAYSLPMVFSEELYSESDITATVCETQIAEWYTDAACTQPLTTFRIGKENSAVYGKVAQTRESDPANQIGYCGFDVYTCEYSEGVLFYDSANQQGVAISEEDAETGNYALKATLNSGTPEKYRSFELRNRDSFLLHDGTTYRIDFSYKITGEAEKATIGFGLGESTRSAENHTVLVSGEYAAGEDYATATLYLTADYSVGDYQKFGYVPVGVVAADQSATVYIDNITVSALVDVVGASRLTAEAADTAGEQALRFYFSYQSAGRADLVRIAGSDYEVAERGILVKNAKIKTPLTLENVENFGIVSITKKEMLDSCWSHNEVTDTVVYSGYITGFELQDSRAVSACGYLRLRDGTVYYSETLTASVSALPTVPDFLNVDSLNLSNGELTHSSVSESVVSQASGIQSMEDAYFYLPQGSVLECDHEYKVFLYDLFFELQPEWMRLNGSELSGLNPSWVTGKYVMQKGAYVRLTVRGKVADVRITVPTEKSSEVLSGDREYLAYGVEYELVEKQISKTADGSVNYLFITDIHYSSSDSEKIKTSLFRQMNTVAKMANEDDSIDFVAVGGDITTGMYNTKAQAIRDTQEILDPLKNCIKPVLVMMGNHDDNCYHIYSGDRTYHLDRIISELDWSQNITDRYGPQSLKHDENNPDSRYFYYDIEGKKTRIICLDAIDYDCVTDESGMITQLIPKGNNDFYTGASYWGYSAEQVRWVANQALQMPEGWDCIFMSHMGIDYDTNCYGGPVGYGTQLRKLIESYQKKQEYQDAEIGTVDFRQSTGKVLAYQFGHMHTELVTYSEDIDLWQISTATPNLNQYSMNAYKDGFASSNINNKELDWRYYRRAYDTVSEFCFDAMSVNRDVLYKYPFGAGGQYRMVLQH